MGMIPRVTGLTLVVPWFGLVVSTFRMQASGMERKMEPVDGSSTCLAHVWIREELNPVLLLSAGTGVHLAKAIILG